MAAKPNPVITIDGASGTGKGTVSLKLARHLGWHFLDSGVLYRLLALAALEQSVSFTDEAALQQLAQGLDVQFIAPDSDSPHILLANKEVTLAIRGEKMGNAASIVSAFAKVRTALFDRQRAFSRPPGLVADGRDMGTVIFPEAELKIFLKASPEERAKRRYKQLKEQGISANLSDLLKAINERDKRDMERTVAPLKPAADAICIDTDHLTITEVVERILEEVTKKKI